MSKRGFSCRGDRAKAEWAVQVAVGTAVAFSLASAADATEVKFPKAKPQIAMVVPDGWSVTEAAGGLELRSPEKDSYIVAGLMKQDKATVDGWTKAAGEKLKGFGVRFDDKAKPPPAKPSDLAPVGNFAPTTPAAGGLTFSGTPSLATPGTQGSNEHAEPGAASLEALTGLGAPTTPKNKPPFRVAQYFGTTLANKPIDVQLVIFRLPKKRIFVMDQASGPTDGRAVAIVQSVRTVE